jgi:hypothetical protein
MNGLKVNSGMPTISLTGQAGQLSADGGEQFEFGQGAFRTVRLIQSADASV